MSIVEKALSKLQESGKAVNELRPGGSAPEGVRNTANGAASGIGAATAATHAAIVEPRRAELQARGHLVVDVSALQSAGLLPQQQDALAVRNQFRRLKWPVLDEVASRRREAQACAGAIMIASALPGEGKSFVTCNLAMSIAREENHRVIMVDADVAKGHLSDAFGVREKTGLVDFLGDPSIELADVLLATSMERLFVLPAGKFVPHVSELMSSARMLQLLTTLTNGGPGTIVLLDSSPLLATSEAQVLSRIASQILMIVRANSTPQPSVLEACNLLSRDKVSAVLNQTSAAFGGESYDAAYGTYYNEQK